MRHNSCLSGFTLGHLKERHKENYKLQGSMASPQPPDPAENLTAVRGRGQGPGPASDPRLWSLVRLHTPFTDVSELPRIPFGQSAFDKMLYASVAFQRAVANNLKFP